MISQGAWPVAAWRAVTDTWTQSLQRLLALAHRWMSCLGDLHNKAVIYLHWQTGTLRGSRAKTLVGHFTLHWLHWVGLVSLPSCVSNEPDTGPYQHSDPGARGNMWPGSQLIRRRTLGSRKMCCHCRHTGTVARPFRSGVWVAVLLHRYASPFKPNVFDLKDR